MYYRTKKQVHILLHPTEGNSKLDKIINTFLITLIILNVIVVILETEHAIYIQHQSFFKNFDTISVIIFSIEYVLRVWSATHEKKYKHWLRGRLRYMLTWGAIIDPGIYPSFLSPRFYRIGSSGTSYSTVITAAESIQACQLYEINPDDHKRIP